LNRELHEIARRVRAGEAPDRATRDARARLTQNGFVVDYIDVRDERDLSVATPDMPPDHLVALVAARLGTTRLIDNLPIAQTEAVQAS
jgi:pantoate--beta-alanine ligase